MNRITEDDVNELLDSAEVSTTVMFGKETLSCFKLPNGFTITGRSACVDPANFDAVLGKSIARDDAKRQLWAFEGYRLQCELANKDCDLEVGLKVTSVFGQSAIEMSNGETGLTLNLNNESLEKLIEELQTVQSMANE
jgi:hypothetical protein